jgi:hypothetical protein
VKLLHTIAHHFVAPTSHRDSNPFSSAFGWRIASWYYIQAVASVDGHLWMNGRVDMPLLTNCQGKISTSKMAIIGV